MAVFQSFGAPAGGLTKGPQETQLNGMQENGYLED